MFSEKARKKCAQLVCFMPAEFFEVICEDEIKLQQVQKNTCEKGFEVSNY